MKLRFSIRDLLWFTAVFVLAFGWILDHRIQSEARREAQATADHHAKLYQGLSKTYDNLLDYQEALIHKINDRKTAKNDSHAN